MKEGQGKGNIYGRLSILLWYWLQGLHSLKIPGFVRWSAEQTEYNWSICLNLQKQTVS